MKHDPQCDIANQTPNEIGGRVGVCYCELIARVRADERKVIALRLLQPIKEVLFQACMAWEPLPQGAFDDIQLAELAEGLVAAIRGGEQE